MARSTLQGRRVVVTGASSGAGRAIAEAFAAEGARLVLAARGPEGLNRVAETCRLLDAEAIVVPTDVTRAEEVQALAARALEAFGSIDVWCNVVGTGAVGLFHATPVEAHEQVIRTNLLGHMYGAHAALPVFLEQGRGTLINMISLGGYVPAPFAAAYTASKFALRGFGEALRGEMARHPGIHVCDVFPTFLDTPGIHHAANYTGKRIGVPPPVADPLRVAEAFVHLARHPHPVTLIGVPARLGRLGHMVAPNLMAVTAGRLFDSWFRNASPEPMTEGNLYEPSRPAGQVFGNLRDAPGLRGRRAIAGAAVIAGVGAALVALSRRRRQAA